MKPVSSKVCVVGGAFDIEGGLGVQSLHKRIAMSSSKMPKA
jgi:hypothetical protein